MLGDVLCKLMIWERFEHAYIEVRDRGFSATTRKVETKNGMMEELGIWFLFDPHIKMTKIMSSLYMREMALYDLAFKRLWSVLKSILVSGLH